MIKIERKPCSVFIAINSPVYVFLHCIEIIRNGTTAEWRRVLGINVKLPPGYLTSRHDWVIIAHAGHWTWKSDTSNVPRRKRVRSHENRSRRDLFSQPRMSSDHFDLPAIYGHDDRIKCEKSGRISSVKRNRFSANQSIDRAKDSAGIKKRCRG